MVLSRMADITPHSPQAIGLYLSVLILGGIFSSWDVVAFWLLGLTFLVFVVVTFGDLMVKMLLWEPKKMGYTWPWIACVKEKALMLIFVVFSAAVDVLLYVATYIMPGEFGVFQRGWMWLTFTSLFFFSAFQILRAARNWNSVGGTAPPLMMLASKMLMRYENYVSTEDRERMPRDTNGMSEPPPSRWRDTEPQKLEEIQKRAVVDTIHEEHLDEVLEDFEEYHD